MDRGREGRSRWGSRRAWLCSLGSIVLLPGHAAAEDPAPRRRGVRITAIRAAETPDDPSAFTTVIEPDRRQGEAETVASLLSDSVGVQVRNFGGRGQPAEISIRGSTSQQVVVLLDGVRLNSPQTGTVDLSTIPLDLIERIEVTRGGGSAQVGSDAIGGVVNLISRRPKEKPTTRAAFGGGSFGTWEGSFSHSRRIGDDRELTLGYDGFKTEGDWDFQTAEVRSVVDVPSRELERINNDAESHSGLLRLSRKLSDRFRLSLSDSLAYNSRGQPGLDARQNPDAHERRTRNVTDLLLSAEDLAEGRARAETRVFHRFERVRYRDPSRQFGTPIDARNTTHSVGSSSAVDGALEWGSLEWLPSARLDLRREALDSRQFGLKDRFVAGVFVQPELRLWGGFLALLPALRFEHNEGFSDQWIPRIGAVIEPLPWLRFKGNLEESYRAPSFDELFFDFGSIRGNPNLSPEKAVNADAGVEVGFASLGPISSFRIEASWFYSDIENSIVFQQVSPSTVAATNTNDAEIQGVEVAGAIELLRFVEFSGNYTYQDADRDDGSFDALIQGGGSALPGRAKHESSLRLRIGPTDGPWKLVGERHETSKIPVTFSGRSFVSSRTTWDASAGIDVAQLSPWQPKGMPESLWLSVAANNLTDRSVFDALGFPQPGRTLSFRGEARW